jgi:hypothetical protein
MTNASVSEKGSQHESSGLMTWILGFVFVTIISMSSMLGLLLIPSSSIMPSSPSVTRTTAANDSPPPSRGPHHHVNVMRQGKKSSFRDATTTASAAGISSESSLSSFVSLEESECNQAERLDGKTSMSTTMRRSSSESSSSWTDDDGESSTPSFSFSTSYLHNGLEGLALGSLMASSIFHLIPHAFDLVGQGMCGNILSVLCKLMLSC